MELIENTSMVSDPWLEKNRSDSGSIQRFKLDLRVLKEFLRALEAFSDNYDKKFNVSKLARYLHLSSNETDQMMEFILYIQDIFKKVFKFYSLKKIIRNSQIYFELEKNYDAIPVPEEIILTSSEKELFRDVIYTFKHVQRGKGFNLNDSSKELLKNLIAFRENHPYLFRQNGNNLTYPSPIGLKLGDLMLTYNKSHKPLTSLKVENTQVNFEPDGCQ
jgi:hypothetical protein